MPEIFEDDTFDPKVVFNNLMVRLRTSKNWIIVCVVDESCFVGLGELPFKVVIRNGLFYCHILAPTKKEAMVIVANILPVITFIEYE
jgi:hypothetical protein